MISYSYYKNIPSRNILNDESKEEKSLNSFSDISDIPLENMIINSNLGDSSIIK